MLKKKNTFKLPIKKIMHTIKKKLGIMSPYQQKSDIMPCVVAVKIVHIKFIYIVYYYYIKHMEVLK